MSESAKPLSQLQSAMQQHIVENDSAILREVTGPDDAFRQTRLRIYYSAYRLRLAAALATDYGALKHWVGDTRFDKLALAYLEAHPSPFRNLRWFGRAMAKFLREDPRFGGEPVLSELAEFEWTQGLAFDAVDAPHLTFDDLASVPPEDWANIRFIPHTSLHLITAQWNVIPIWHAHANGEALPKAKSGEQANVIAVWRHDYKSYFRTLDPVESMLWQMLAEGTSFGDACAALATATNMSEEQAPMRAAQQLRQWVDDGWIQSCEVAKTA